MLNVLESARFVVENSKLVRISLPAINKFVENFNYRLSHWNRKLHFWGSIDDVLNYLLALNATNYCFWNLDDDKKWSICYNNKWYSGYNGLAVAYKRAIKEKTPLTNAKYLSELTKKEYDKILKGKGELLLKEKRLAALHEVGKTLTKKYEGKFRNMVEEAGFEAIELVKLIVNEIPSFSDEAYFNFKPIKFYKRAQLLVADIWSAFRGKGVGALKNVANLTCFADYKLPQILREFGILQYDKELEKIVDNKKLIPSGSVEEIEIRANTIWAVELIKEKLANKKIALASIELDYVLWHDAQKLRNARPHHRTITTAY